MVSPVGIGEGQEWRSHDKEVTGQIVYIVPRVTLVEPYDESVRGATSLV